MSEIRKEHLSLYEVVFVLRPRPGKILEQILKTCHKLGIRTIADVDDLVFVPKYAALSPSVLNKQATEFSMRAQYKRNLEAMLCFDEVTVATAPLQRYWTEQTGQTNVTVIPNGLSKRWLDTPVKRMAGDDHAERTITYLPGSNSHNKDFAEIIEILSETLDNFEKVRLLIVGTLHVDEGKIPADRLLRSEFVDYYKLPQIIANSTVTLAPLVRSPFTHAKSHIKFIESAAFGTPAICSPTDDICRHHSIGLDVVETADEWRAALQLRLDTHQDEETRLRMEQDIRRSVTADLSVDRLLTHLQNIKNRSLRRAVGQ